MTIFLRSLSWLGCLLVTLSRATAADVTDYNVVWDSPSKDQHGSMPLGNGDIGVNTWVEPTGDLVFVISKTDAWDDNGRLLKVGKVRLKCDPPLLEKDDAFQQTLDLAKGMLVVKVTRPDKTMRSELRLWIDANRPLIEVDVQRDVAGTATAAVELWRNKPLELPSIEVSDVMLDRSKPKQMHAPTIVEPDTVLTAAQSAALAPKSTGTSVGWFHHNIKSVGPEITAKIQGMQNCPRLEPLLHRTFGAVIATANGTRVDDTHLQAAPAKQHRFTVAVLTDHPSQPEAWQAHIGHVLTEALEVPAATRQREHEAWWQAFWQRSWIHVTGPEGRQVSQAYALQRYVTACAGRGRYPIKFNGTIFTVAYENTPGDADYRRWGPGYWWQNTRLPYISLNTSGDFEMQEPLWRLYVDDFLPINKYRTQRYFQFDEAAYYPECVYFWGDVFSETYGWTPVEDREDPLQAGGWHKREWVGGLELVFMLQDAYDFTQDERLLTQRILPTARAVTRFFDRYYKTNPAGKLEMQPSQALETFWECTNPMPEVAGLRAVIRRLLALSPDKLPEADRIYWTALFAKLPELPTHEIKGQRAWAPAEKYAGNHNIENPELYCVFPFRLSSFEQDNRELGRAALTHRLHRGHSGWRQDDLFMAYLGEAEQARTNIVNRAKSFDKRSRFPAFWGPNYDWVPDQDHGGVLLKGLQSLLIQADPYSRKIYLLPAWPKNWDCEFKFHAPYRTTIQGQVRDGKLLDLQVTPAERRRDIVIVGQ